jgi:hypothetical protein
MAFRLAALLPWRAFVLPTFLQPDEAAQVLAENISNESDFRGERLDNLHFEISRVLEWGYKSSFVPVISVAIEPRVEGGALVAVSMRLHLVVAIFSLFWMTGTTFGGFLSLVAALGGEPEALWGLALPLFGALLIGGGFAFEAARAERLLRELFPAPPEGAPPYR